MGKVLVPAAVVLGGFCVNKELPHFRGQVKCGWRFYVQDWDTVQCVCFPVTLLVLVPFHFKDKINNIAMLLVGTQNNQPRLSDHSV